MSLFDGVLKPRLEILEAVAGGRIVEQMRPGLTLV
jgi:hypothetical protein